MGSGILFCPTCSNILLVEKHGENQFSCSTCCYQYYITKQITKVVPLKRKQVEPVLGGDEAWKNAPRTEARCAACGNNQAYFLEVQTRSADEAATLFLRCIQCKKVWSEN